MTQALATRLKQTFLLLFTLLIASGCSFKHFQEKVLLPKIKIEEAEEEIHSYLIQKYGKEFTIAKLERGCTGLGSDCAKQVYAYVYPNETPGINFRVTYDTKTKKIRDDYLQAVLENQIEKEFQDFLEENFEGRTFVAIRSNVKELDVASFPDYRELLGKEITNIKFVATLYKWTESEESWRIEAKKLMKLKQVLMNKGFDENQLKAFEIAVWVRDRSSHDADAMLLYKVNLSGISEEDSAMKAIQEQAQQ